MMTTLIVIAVASLCANILQWIERKQEHKETRRLIEDATALEHHLDDVTAKYENEVEHRRWAIGRIKDQQKVISQLERNFKPRKQRKEVSDERV